MADKSKSAIIIQGGKITLEDNSQNAWENCIRLFEVLSKTAKVLNATILFETPDVRRGFLDAVTSDYLEKKYTIHIVEGRSEAPVNVVKQILELAKGFDIGVKFTGVEMMLYHTGKVEMMTDMQRAEALSKFVQKMFPKAKVK